MYKSVKCNTRAAIDFINTLLVENGNYYHFGSPMQVYYDKIPCWINIHPDGRIHFDDEFNTYYATEIKLEDVEKIAKNYGTVCLGSNLTIEVFKDHLNIDGEIIPKEIATQIYNYLHKSERGIGITLEDPDVLGMVYNYLKTNGVDCRILSPNRTHLRYYAIPNLAQVLSGSFKNTYNTIEEFIREYRKLSTSRIFDKYETFFENERFHIGCKIFNRSVVCNILNNKIIKEFCNS